MKLRHLFFLQAASLQNALNLSYLFIYPSAKSQLKGFVKAVLLLEFGSKVEVCLSKKLRVPLLFFFSAATAASELISAAASVIVYN